MKTEKPRLGVAFFAARWFDDVVLGKNETADGFRHFLAEESTRVQRRLASNLELVVAPIVDSMEKGRNAARRFLAEDVDAVLLDFLVWSEDEYLLPFRDIMEVRPSILWASTPYRTPPKKSAILDLFVNSGIVGTFEAFGVLKGAAPRRSPFLVTGCSLDEKTYEDIERIARAARARSALRSSRLGILPYRNPQMIVTYVDEFALYCSIGPAVEYVSALALKKIADSIPESAVGEYARKIASECSVDPRVTESNLEASARASLGMEKLLFDRRLDGLALSDLNPELHEVMGLRPCLYPERLAESEKVVGNEGDLGGTTAMLMLRMLAGKPVLFTEIFNFDATANTVLAGHAGPANPLLADRSTGVSISPDYELMDSPSGIGGVWMEFIAGSGRITMVNFFQRPRGDGEAGGFQMTILGGESLGGALRIEGYPHAAVRIDVPLDRFLESCAANGTSHHWAIVHGDVRVEMRHLGEMLGIRTVDL